MEEEEEEVEEEEKIAICAKFFSLAHDSPVVVLDSPQVGQLQSIAVPLFCLLMVFAEGQPQDKPL